MRPGSSVGRRAGFTLVELGIVILIIGILMSFLLVASWEGLKRSNERATQSLIQKLDLAVSDRIEALVSQRPEPNNAHRFLAMSVNPVTPAQFAESEARARLIAQIDYLKRELPDVFFVQDATPGAEYPLNFAGVPFKPSALEPGAGSSNMGFPGIPDGLSPYILPLGHAMRVNGVEWNSTTKTFDPLAGSFIPLGEMSGLGPKPPAQLRFTSPPAGQGIFGASYSAIGSLTRQLGYPLRGYNGIDDDNNGLIDERTAAEFGLSGAEFDALNTEITRRLNNHRHITARSEMLYAILVGGVGPLGSVFSPDDFTDREVQDTDDDGLPEFVDAWGRPLQFYRWPTHFTSEQGARSLQMGDAPYLNIQEVREENPLDPNQLLVSPGWWADLNNLPPPPASNANSSHMSRRANLFQQQFFSLTDPYADGGAASHWDRSSYYKRRAYYFKHLILSAGPDRQYGVGSYGLEYSASGQGIRPFPTAPPPVTSPEEFIAANAARLTLIENQASRSRPFARESQPGFAGTQPIVNAANLTDRMFLYQAPATGDGASIRMRDDWGVDDITNHSLNTLGSGGR